MLGRVRASPLDCSELERPSPKIIKSDALSIYEATLEKLRLGSRRALGSSSMKTKTEAPSSSLSASPSSSDVQSVDTSAMNIEEVPCSSSLSASPNSSEVQSVADCSDQSMELEYCSSRIYKM
ncbi:hypothetical protein NE237_006557 [Protea cynaroides]|uniref:Uncharacterized protein n=1 Tax=Protea cynaroides TaxID=273540 RepID=A0A9Q0KMI2_9MAGN|nr:hypothetical protein NE237_006557 [Protea cynaroides]